MYHYNGSEYCGENGGDKTTCPLCKVEASWQGAAKWITTPIKVGGYQVNTWSELELAPTYCDRRRTQHKFGSGNSIGLEASAKLQEEWEKENGWQ